MRILKLLLVITFLATTFVLPVKAQEQGNMLVSDFGNQYLANDNVVINTDVKGDAYAVGNRITVDGKVNKNLLAVAGGVVINKEVGGDVTIIASYVVINGNIKGDVRVIAEQAVINSKNISGDLIFVGKKIELDKNTKVFGTEEFRSQSEPTRNTGFASDLSAYDNGIWNSIYQLNLSNKPSTSSFRLMNILVYIITVAGSILSYYFVLRAFPVFSENSLLHMRKSPKQAIIVGLLSMLAAIPAAVVLIISIIGWELLLILSILFVLSAYLAKVYASYLIGRMIMHRFKAKDTGRLLPLIIGTVVVSLGYWILGLIPFIGFVVVALIGITFTAWGLGGVLNHKLTFVQELLKKRG